MKLNKSNIIWLLIGALVFGLAYIRPIHQDDGWYASFAMRYLKDWNLMDNVSYFSYYYSNGGNDKPGGFIFSILQIPFFLTFGITVLASRLFNAIVITILLYNLHNITKKFAPNFKWIIIILAILHPVIYYHYYNRPEILAMCFALISINLLLESEISNSKIFIAFFLWSLILDAHPIGLFSVLGIGIVFWKNNLNKTKYVLFGGLSGFIVYLFINYTLNGVAGILGPLFGQAPVNFGDHYVPLFESNLADYIRIAKERFDTLKSTLVFGLIWLTLPLYIYKKRSFGGINGALLFNTICFWILSIFLTEASSNGFGLYSQITSLILMVLLFNEAILAFKLNSRWSYYLSIPLILISLRSLLPTLLTNFNYTKSFNTNYYSINNCIEDSSKVLIRPTFAYALSQKNIFADQSFGIMNVMLDSNFTFEQAIRRLNYDYVFVDEMNINEEFIIDKRDSSLFTSPAYSKYKNTGLYSREFDSLISNKFLVKTCEYNDISHGLTIVYKVAKD